MNTSNRVCALLGMELPIIQAGMVWCSGWELASAVSGAGGLGILGAGSMYPEVLRDQIQKVQAAAPGKPFAVNVPLLYPAVEEHMASIVELGVPIVFTSAGNPRTWTKHLQDHGIKVVHVVSSVKFALKAQEPGWMRWWPRALRPADTTDGKKRRPCASCRLWRMRATFP